MKKIRKYCLGNYFKRKRQACSFKMCSPSLPCFFSYLFPLWRNLFSLKQKKKEFSSLFLASNIFLSKFFFNKKRKRLKRLKFYKARLQKHWDFPRLYSEASAKKWRVKFSISTSIPGWAERADIVENTPRILPYRMWDVSAIVPEVPLDSAQVSYWSLCQSLASLELLLCQSIAHSSSTRASVFSFPIKLLLWLSRQGGLGGGHNLPFF